MVHFIEAVQMVQDLVPVLLNPVDLFWCFGVPTCPPLESRNCVPEANLWIPLRLSRVADGRDPERVVSSCMFDLFDLFDLCVLWCDLCDLFHSDIWRPRQPYCTDSPHLSLGSQHSEAMWSVWPAGEVSGYGEPGGIFHFACPLSPA